MSVDERLQTALRDAANGPALDVDDALGDVRARVDTVDLVERSRPPARAPRVVAVLAACALIAGAVVLPFALHSTRDHPTAPAAAGGGCGHDVTKGYRSTAIVRLARNTVDGTAPFRITFADPIAEAVGLCDRVLALSHPRNDEIRFAADTTSNLLSLAVSTRNPNDAAALARRWASEFVAARRADAAHQIIDQQNQLSARVRRLHDELRSVDSKLAKLAPGIYGSVAQVDAPNSSPDRPPKTVPPVPETGSVKLLNLAFERISLLQALRDSATTSSSLRITRVRPDAYATVVSVSAPVRFPAHDDSNWPGVLIAAGLIAAGALLGAGGFLLGRRRRAQSP